MCLLALKKYDRFTCYISSFLQLSVAEQVDVSTTTFSELVKMNYPNCVARKSALSPGSNKLSSK